MFEQQAEHIAYIIAEAVKRKATTVEPSKAQEGWTSTIKELAIDTSAFDLSCTRLLQQRGQRFRRRCRSFLGDYYMAGFYASTC